MPNLKIGKDGVPTDDSMRNLEEQLSKRSGKGTPAKLTCSSADPKKVADYAKEISENKDRENIIGIHSIPITAALLQEMPPKQVNNFMKINKSFILIIALILVIIYLACSIVDKSITLSYSNQGCESARADIDNVISLIEREWRGMDMEQTAYKLKNSSINKKAVSPQIKMENDLIWYGDVKFTFSSGRLAKVEY